MSGAETAAKNDSYLGGKRQPRPRSLTFFGGQKNPLPTSQSSTSRVLAGPPVQATAGFQGPGNPVSYVQVVPPPTANGNVRASRVMAQAMNPVFNMAGLRAAKPLAPTRNTNARPAFLNAYGPGVTGNNAPPEAAAFWNGGSPVRMKSPANPQNTRHL